MQQVCPQCGDELEEQRVKAAGWGHTFGSVGVKLSVSIFCDALVCKNHPDYVVIKQQDLKDFAVRTWRTASLNDIDQIEAVGDVDAMVDVERVKI